MKFEDKITGRECKQKEQCLHRGMICPNPKYGCLRPLYNAKVIVHYPFFANTYILPFFYSKIIDNIEQEKKLLQLSEWGVSSYTEIFEKIKQQKSSIHLLYITSETLLKIMPNTQRTIKQHLDDYTYLEVNFCNYFPRFVFIDFSVNALLHFYNEEQIDEYSSMRDFLTEHFLHSIQHIFKKTGTKNISLNEVFSTFIKGKKIQIYTDTKDEAVALQLLLENGDASLKNNIVIIDNDIQCKLSNKEVINLYFYSAPHNIFFLKKKMHLLPLQLGDIYNHNEDVRGLLEYFDTKCYLVAKANTDHDLLTIIKSKLDIFFEYIFWKAKETPEHFHEITQSFNHRASLTQPSIIFEDQYCFSKCLSLHVAPSSFENIEKELERESNLSKRLLFDSLFHYSHNTKYNKCKDEMLGYNIQQLYSLIAFKYLLDKLEDIYRFKNKTFSAICESVATESSNNGFYEQILNNFIKIQSIHFMMKFKEYNDNPIYEAHSVYKIDINKIYHKITAEVKHYFLHVLVKECSAADIFDIKSGRHFSFFTTIQDGKMNIQSDIRKLNIEENCQELICTLNYINNLFDNLKNIFWEHREDIIDSDYFGLSSVFQNKVVENALNPGFISPN